MMLKESCKAGPWTQCYKTFLRQFFNVEIQLKCLNLYNFVATLVQIKPKGYLGLSPGAYTIKLFTVVIYGFRNKLVRPGANPEWNT